MIQSVVLGDLNRVVYQQTDGKTIMRDAAHVCNDLVGILEECIMMSMKRQLSMHVLGNEKKVEVIRVCRSSSK